MCKKIFNTSLSIIKTTVVRIKSIFEMRFFTSFHFVQNDSKLRRNGYYKGVVLRQRRKTTPL